MLDKSKIPKGPYCYDINGNGTCPHWREDARIKSDLYGYGHVESVWCDLLRINSAVLDFEGVYENDSAKCFTAHLLRDMCKLCSINE